MSPVRKPANHEAGTTSLGISRDSLAAAVAGVAEVCSYIGAVQPVNELVHMVQVRAAIAGLANPFSQV